MNKPQFVRWFLEVLNQEYSGDIKMFKDKIN